MNELTDQEKSVLLAKAMGADWRYFHNDEIDEWLILDSENVVIGYGNLYDPANMALAWRVHLWTLKQELGKRESPYAVSPKPYTRWWNLGSPWGYADAQRKWLDRIFDLCVEAKLIEVTDE